MLSVRATSRLLIKSSTNLSAYLPELLINPDMNESFKI